MTPLPQLPTCRWRGLPQGAHFPCSSPKLVVGPAGVTAEVCLACPFPDVGVESREPLTYADPPDLSRPVVDPAPTAGRVVVTCAAGSTGRDLLAVSRPLMEAYARRVSADFYVIDVPESAFPVGEKFRCHALARSWRRLLFLDADVLVGPACPDLFALVPEGQIGMHDDLADVAALAGADWLRRQYADLAASQGWAVPSGYIGVLNSGVVVWSAAHAGLWEPPARPYPAYHRGEQNVVNWNAYCRGYPVYRLPAALNYQWWAHPDMAGPAHLWHYAKPLRQPEEQRLRAMRAHVGGRPGWHLTRMVAAAGLAGGPDCQCAKHAARMDEWGVDGCRDRRAEVVGWLVDAWRAAGWLRGLLTGARGVIAAGLPFSPRDPVGVLVDEALRRAAADRLAPP